MPPFIAKKHAANKGDEFECRVARLMFVEGAFVKRKVDLEPAFGERFQITDVDVLVLEFSDTLTTRTGFGECKTTEAKSAPTATDRLLWNSGLQQLAAADHGFVAVSKKASANVRRLAGQLGAEFIEPEDLVRRESLLCLEDDQGWGPNHPDSLVLQRAVRDLVKGEDQLRRIYWFVRSEFWFAAPVGGLKRALGAAKAASRLWSERLPDDERRSVEWLVREAVIASAVAITRLAGQSYRSPEAIFDKLMIERLAEGLASYRSLQELSKLADEYVMDVLTQAGLDPARRIASLGAFAPKEPGYTEPLLEVIHRFAAAPRATRDVARLLDWRSAAVARGVDALPESALFGHLEDTGRLNRLFKTFLVGQIGIPGKLLEFMDDPAGEHNGEIPIEKGIIRRENNDTPAEGGTNGAKEGGAASQLEISDAE